MTLNERHAHRLAQKKASYERAMADPARRAAIAAYSKKQYEAKYGPRERADLSDLTPEQKRQRKRELGKISRQKRAATPEYKARQRSASKARVAYKREWQRKNAKELYNRRKKTCLANPEKFKSLDMASRKRRRQNPLYRFVNNLRTRITRIAKAGKPRGTNKLTSCTGAELRAHLERQFLPWMTWENYGKRWHIDHETPLAYFDLTRRDEILRANHYLNLRPMEKSRNLKRGYRVGHATPYLLL